MHTHRNFKYTLIALAAVIMNGFVSHAAAGTFLVKFVNQAASARYIFVDTSSYHIMLPNDTWEETFVNTPSVLVCPVPTYGASGCRTIAINSSTVININF